MDERESARTRAARVVAWLERHDDGRAASRLTGGCQRCHLSMDTARSAVDPFGELDTLGRQHDRPHAGVAIAAEVDRRSERKRMAHRVDLWSIRHLPCPRSGRETRGGRREDRSQAAPAAPRGVSATRPRAPPIRTLTVGPGVSPGQPAAGGGRVADYHRRFGISPTPEHASVVTRCDKRTRSVSAAHAPLRPGREDGSPSGPARRRRRRPTPRRTRPHRPPRRARWSPG